MRVECCGLGVRFLFGCCGVCLCESAVLLAWTDSPTH